MPRTPLSAETDQRLRVVRRLEAVASGTDPIFADLARAAALACRTPRAAIAVLDRHGLRLIAGHGGEDGALEVHTARVAKLLDADDATCAGASVEPPASGPPLVPAPLLSGVPLRGGDGLVIGALWVVDDTARALEPEQCEALRLLARQVASQLDLRLRIAGLSAEQRQLYRQLDSFRRIKGSLRLLQPAIEQAGDAVMITTPEIDDLGPTILYVNPAMIRLTGYPAEELLGATPRILRGPRTDPVVLERMRAALAAGRDFTTTLVHYRKDGTEDVVEWHVSPIRNDSRRVTHLLCIQRNVHDRWQSEQRIAARIDRARAEYAAAFQALPELCFRLAGDGTILDYQAAAPENLYLPPEAFLHRRMQEVLPPEIGEMTSAAIAEALQSRETVVCRYTLPIGGQPQHFEARHVPLPGNEVLAMVRSLGEESEPSVQ